MEDKIRLVWDFHGPDAKPTAEHHARHLVQFAEKESLALKETGIEMVSESHFYAYLDVISDQMILVRDALRPARGLRIEE